MWKGLLALDNDGILVFIEVIFEIIFHRVVLFVGKWEVELVIPTAGQLDVVTFFVVFGNFSFTTTATTGPVRYEWLARKFDTFKEGGVVDIKFTRISKWGINTDRKNSKRGTDDARDLVFKDSENEEDDCSEAVDDGNEMIWEIVAKATDIGDCGNGEQDSHDGKDDAGIPFIVFDVPANESTWESGERNFEPVWIILEEMPTHAIERNLDEINEWLGNKEESEGFESSVEWLLTVNDDEDGWQYPPFWRDDDVMEGIAVWHE